MKRTVTYSELKSRRRCPWAAYLNYDKRLSPVVKSPGLREGTIMDKGLDELYYHVKAIHTYMPAAMLEAMTATYRDECGRIAEKTKLMDEEWQLIKDRYMLLRDVATNYVAYAKDHDNWQVVATQFEGKTPVISPNGRGSTRYDYAFKLDGLVVVDGQLWVLENKAWKTIGNDAIASLQTDEQCSMYLWAFNQMAERGTLPSEAAQAVAEFGKPVGVIYNVIRKAIPSVPAVLKSGKTSQDKRIDTTEQVYLDTLISRGEKPEDYAEALDALRAKGDTFHYRERVYRNADELKEVGRQIWDLTRFLAASYRFKCHDRSCTWECSYRPLCLEWSQELAQSGYYVREKQHEEYEELAA